MYPQYEYEDYYDYDTKDYYYDGEQEHGSSSWLFISLSQLVTNGLIFQIITTTTRLPPAPVLARALAPARARASAPALGSQLAPAPARAPALGSLQARASNDGPHEGS